MGALLGGSTSALQVAQAKVGRLRDEQLRSEAALVTPLTTGTEPLDVDRPVERSLPMGTVTVDETSSDVTPIAPVGKGTGNGSSWYSWIPGMGK